METNNIVFGVHTAQIKCWITAREYREITTYFGMDANGKLKDKTRYYEQGITDIWLEKVKGKERFKYYMHIIINFTRALNAGDYKMMPYTAKNMKNAFAAINSVFKKIPLTDRNNKVANWTLERLDYGFDIYEPHPDILMELMNKSLDLSSKTKHCERQSVYGRSKEELISESMRFGNASFNYNNYVKIKEIDNNHKSITEEERKEIQYLCRVERQTLPGSIKKIIPSKKVGELSDSKIIESAMKIIIDEIKLFFGTGDFYSCYGIKKRYSSYSEYQNDEGYRNAKEDLHNIALITKTSLEDERQVYTREMAERLTRMSIAPVGIKKEYGIEYIEGLYNRIVKVYQRPQDKRRYGNFPVPHRGKDGRYRANITLYWANGQDKKVVSIADKDLSGYEKKVFYKLREVYLLNRIALKSDNQDIQATLRKSVDSLIRFKKTIKTTELKNEIESFLETYKSDNTF